MAVLAGLIALCSSAQGVISVDSKASVLPDGNVELLLTVSLEPGWYMYSTVPVSGGPMATSFTAVHRGRERGLHPLRRAAGR